MIDMEIIRILLALSENNDERNQVDPRKQLSALYREIKEVQSLIIAAEKKLDFMNRENQERQDELDLLVQNGPKWTLEITRAKDRMVRQRGLTLKDMLEIQQEVVRLEENVYYGEARIVDLRDKRTQHEKASKQLISKIRELKTQYNQQAEVYNQEKGKADLLMSLYAEKENTLLEGVPPEAGKVYREALRTNPLNPVVNLEGEICGGCRIGLSKQQIKQINQKERLIFCENCLRIILPPYD
ncbi:MAG: C4-type zinc ribbon domain-containing protein [Peptococcaceae bacterium]|jgi:predicted  nucleic acid-binding Zn-ribbon protein|nr:C4-type zinc ribbon domain-containing protein [Peptococcaceae bacterium]